MTKKKKHIFFIVVLLFLVNIIAINTHFRWDVTNDHRYSISKPTITLLENLKKEVTITVFLTGDLPFDFERLSKETAYFLEEITSKNKHISFNFIQSSRKRKKFNRTRINTK